MDLLEGESCGTEFPENYKRSIFSARWDLDVAEPFAEQSLRLSDDQFSSKMRAAIDAWEADEIFGAVLDPPVLENAMTAGESGTRTTAAREFCVYLRRVVTNHLGENPRGKAILARLKCDGRQNKFHIGLHLCTESSCCPACEALYTRGVYTSRPNRPLEWLDFPKGGIVAAEGNLFNFGRRNEA